MLYSSAGVADDIPENKIIPVPFAVNGKGNAALVGVFYGIGKDIGNHLLYPDCVAVKCFWQRGACFNFKLQHILFDKRAYHSFKLVNDIRKVILNGNYIKLAGLYL